MFTIRNFKLC